MESVRGFGPPIRDVIGDGPVLRLLDRVAAWLARLWPSLFAYQFLVEARRLPCVDDLAEHPAARRVDEPAEDPSAHRGGADGAGS